MAAWKPLIVSPAPEPLRRALAEAGAAEGVPVAEYPRHGAIAALTARHGCNLCLIDLAGDLEQALAAIGDASPSLPVVAVNPRNDADVILRALRRGAREFLAEITADAARAVLDRLAAAQSPAKEPLRSRMIVVVPGKPGCGASTVAAHLAIRARPAGGARALLVDADSITGSIAFLFKLKSEHHLGEAARDWKRMDQDLWSRLAVPYEGIDVLLAPESVAARFTIEPPVASALAAFWRQRYDTIVVDTPGAQAAAESGFAALADDLLLVATNELSPLHATRRAIEFLEQTVPDRARLRLLLNRYTPATGLKRGDVKTALALEPFATLPNDYDALQAAILEGRPAPSSTRFAAGVDALSRLLRGRPAAAPKGGWLSRLAFAK